MISGKDLQYSKFYFTLDAHFFGFQNCSIFETWFDSESGNLGLLFELQTQDCKTQGFAYLYERTCQSFQPMMVTTVKFFIYKSFTEVIYKTWFHLQKLIYRHLQKSFSLAFTKKSFTNCKWKRIYSHLQTFWATDGAAFHKSSNNIFQRQHWYYFEKNSVNKRIMWIRLQVENFMSSEKKYNINKQNIKVQWTSDIQ